jgi:putative membrane protein
MTNTGIFRTTRLAAAAFIIVACDKKDSSSDTTAGSSSASPDTSATAASSTVSGGWTDANILALLDEANADDSASGALAATKGTSSAVRDFGKRMVRDHHSLRIQGELLAKKLSITPTLPSDDPLASDIQKYAQTLASTAKGKDFDRAYTDAEVDMHKKVLGVVTRAMNQAQSTELKNLIQKAAPVIVGHLDLAESIQKNLK